jgi:8-oxo-dGTP pyrophosphatase MutT (NUDIX family)
MNEIKLYSFDDNVKVCFNQRKASLPKQYSDGCDAHWESLLKKGKKYFRGDIFTISDIKHDSQGIMISVELTDYAHFLYTLNRNAYEDHDCRVIYTSVLVETADGKFVIGIMGEDTFAPQKLQLFGGGIDKGDLKGNEIDLENSAKKEIVEELGIDVNDLKIVKQFRRYLLKEGGRSNFYSAVFKLDLLLNQDEVKNSYEKYVQQLSRQGIKPEIESLLFVPRELDAIEKFASDKREKDENLIPVLKASVGLFPVNKL